MPPFTMVRGRIALGFRTSLDTSFAFPFRLDNNKFKVELPQPRCGKVSVGGDGNERIIFTSRPDVARYVFYVLTRLPPNN